MQSERRTNTDEFSESLESRLRKLPKFPVPDDLESRLLAAIPTQQLQLTAHRQRASRLLRTSLTVTGFAIAACVAIVFLRPRAIDKDLEQGVAKNPIQIGINSESELELVRNRRSQMVADNQIFSWPIYQKSPLMVSSAIPSDLLD